MGLGHVETWSLGKREKKKRCCCCWREKGKKRKREKEMSWFSRFLRLFIQVGFSKLQASILGNLIKGLVGQRCESKWGP